MKKQTLGFILLVIFGMLAIGLVVKYNKIVWGHDVSEKQGEMHLHGDGNNGSGEFRILPGGAVEDTTEYYWIFTAPDGDEITINKAEWSLEVEEGTQLTFIKSPQFTGDEIVYLGTETVIDSTWTEPSRKSTFNDEPSGDILLSHRTHYLNLRINGTDYRIAMKEIRGKLCK